MIRFPLGNQIKSTRIEDSSCESKLTFEVFKTTLINRFEINENQLVGKQITLKCQRPPVNRDLIIDSQTKLDKVLETILDPNTTNIDRKLEAEIILTEIPKGNPFLQKSAD